MSSDQGHAEGQPPHDLTAERALLGEMLISTDAITDMVETLHGYDFYRRAHESIYLAILEVYGRNEPVDTMSVRQVLADHGTLAQAGGVEYLLDLAKRSARGNGAPNYAERVQATATLRRMMAAAHHIEELASAGAADNVDEIVNTAQAEIFAATTRPSSLRPALTLGDIMEGALDEIEMIGSRNGQLPGVPTGFHDLDALTGGLQGGQLIVLAGRPAMGKSTLALDFLRTASIKNHLPSVLFTLEAGQNEVAMRLLSAEARVALHAMRSGKMVDSDWERLARRMPDVSAAPLFIQDGAYSTLVDVRAQCRRLRSQRHIALIVVDALHLLTYGTRPFSSRYEEISEIARCLKLLAKELDVPVVAVSQLNRGPEQRTDKRPMISDLRDSGALEDNADIVILLHREDAYEKESPRAGEADLIVAKHRNGPTATCTVAFQGHYSRFVDMAQT
ncbi:replicative DNA helicase [Streptomyces avidinii]|uniref:replicative DNA helicase n=1 Tax=Streptomyces avidinii TaxID=1895 RepID=UPI003795FD33